MERGSISMQDRAPLNSPLTLSAWHTKHVWCATCGLAGIPTWMSRTWEGTRRGKQPPKRPDLPYFPGLNDEGRACLCICKSWVAAACVCGRVFLRAWHPCDRCRRELNSDMSLRLCGGATLTRLWLKKKRELALNYSIALRFNDIQMCLSNHCLQQPQLKAPLETDCNMTHNSQLHLFNISQMCRLRLQQCCILLTQYWWRMSVFVVTRFLDFWKKRCHNSVVYGC